MKEIKDKKMQKFDNINKIYFEVMKYEERKKELEEEGYQFVKTISDYKVPEFSIPFTRQPKTDREKFSKVYSIVDMLKHVRSTKECSIINLATTSKKMIAICGSQQNVSNIFQLMKHIGLIETEDSTYRFNAYLDKENRCKSYRYYYENEVLFKDYCIVNNIDKKVVVNTYNSTKTQIPDLELFDNNAGVRIASNLYLKKPINYSKDDFERHLNYVLHQNYPDLEYYEMLADYINQTYYADDVDLQIKYQPNFTWNNKDKGNNNVHKIGIRATNSLVSASKKNDSRTYIIRDDVKRTYKLHLEYDVS